MGKQSGIFDLTITTRGLNGGSRARGEGPWTLTWSETAVSIVHRLSRQHAVDSFSAGEEGCAAEMSGNTSTLEE